ncbi:hypothetical protein B0I27_11630 [Arcticibacter pallidicorallinus]|uniref:Uncharacterized protein n=1 Tax=Arcticibacter pallidicorallinus TaxID=1259464 RepID=A0A2T0TQZ7_9SPHI|nr:hypothetical protein B0I27_11630 [Arcticibacter pallidicorallinus]
MFEINHNYELKQYSLIWRTFIKFCFVFVTAIFFSTLLCAQSNTLPASGNLGIGTSPTTS